MSKTLGMVPLGHQRQAVDGDALRDDLVADLGDRRPLVVGAVARHVDHPLQAAKTALGEQVAGKLQRAGDRGAARAVRRIGGELVDEGLRIGGRRDHRPRHDDVLRGLPGPLDIGDGDLAVDAVLDRLDDAVMGQRSGVALALDLQLVGDIESETSTARISSTSTGSAASAGRRPRGRGQRRQPRLSAPAAGKPEQPWGQVKRKVRRHQSRPRRQRRLCAFTFPGGCRFPVPRARGRAEHQLRGLRLSGS